MRKNRFFNLVFLMCVCFFGNFITDSGVANAHTRKTKSTVVVTKDFDWDKVIDAIIQVESKGNAKAVSPNGSSVGILQITPICVRACNDYLKANGINKRYTNADRYNVKKSREMFVIIQKATNPKNSIEFAIKSWNCGAYYKQKPHLQKKANRYYQKVMKFMQ